jgi:hypothetical protein
VPINKGGRKRRGSEGKKQRREGKARDALNVDAEEGTMTRRRIMHGVLSRKIKEGSRGGKACMECGGR